MSKVFLSAKLPVVTTQILADQYLDVVMYTGTGLITQTELLSQVREIDYLITPLSTQVDAAVIDAAPHLKLIANFGAGFNNIDVAYAKTKGIQVTNTPAISVNSVAEVTIGLLLALSHRIVEGDQLMRAAGFPGWAPLYFLGHELAGKTLGIVGFGHIGQAVAAKAQGLGVKVQYWQPHRLTPAAERRLGVTYVPFAALVASSDFISINAPQTQENHHQFAAAQFRQMKATAYLINVGRGPIVDESALLAALQRQTIAGAALDVYEHEPKVTAGLEKLTNVILTPHIGNATVEARALMGTIVANNVIRVEEGQAAKFVVNA